MPSNSLRHLIRCPRREGTHRGDHRRRRHAYNDIASQYLVNPHLAQTAVTVGDES